MRRLIWLPIVAALIIAAISALPAAAHRTDDFDFDGNAVGCLGATWQAQWSIENFEDSNPFGIIDSDTSDGQDVTFAPLVDDAAPGEYIPPGDTASVTTTHAANVASVTLTVLHDVTNAPDVEFEETVNRPAACATPTPTATPGADDASITVRKVVNNSSNDTTNFNVDISAGILDITNLDENDSPVTRGALIPGLYILTEYSIPSGYAFVAWECVSDQIGLDADSDNALFDVAINLRAGEDVFCTLVNEIKPAATATPIPPTATQAPVQPPVLAPLPTATPSLPSVADSCARAGGIWTPNAFGSFDCKFPSQAPPASSIIQPPRTGDGGLQEPPFAFECNPAGQSWIWIPGHEAFGYWFDGYWLIVDCYHWA